MKWWLTVFLIGYSLAATCNIEDYGAKGDSKTDNTKAIQSALNDCKTSGTVVVPSGSFLTYPLSLSGAASFTLQVTGTLLAGTMNNWPVSGSKYEDFLTITKSSVVTITGTGVFDGQGTPWYIAFDQGKLQHTRPKLIVITDSSNVTLLNVKLLNSPMMNINLNNVQNGEVAHLNITDEWYNNGTTEPHNTDGIDIGSNSNNIHVHDLYIYNGDDSVAIKPGSITNGCTRNILVENSHFYRGHGASIGSVPSGCVQNVVFRNLTLDGEMSGCNLKSYGNQSGFIKNITWQDITLTNTDYCIHINSNYKPEFPEPDLNTEFPETGLMQPYDSIQISDIYLTNIKGSSCHYPAVFDCQSAAPCENIQLDNVNVAAGASVKNMQCTNAHGSTKGSIEPASCLVT